MAAPPLGASPAAPAAPTTWPLAQPAGPIGPGAWCGPGRRGPHRAGPRRPSRSPRPPQASGGRAGTWRPDRRTVAIVGGGPEPLLRAARKSAARTRAQGPRARGSGRAAAAAGGGRRDLESGRGEGRREPPRARSGPAGPAARAAARPRKGYLLHGSLDGGVWGLGLLQQLQDLLKSLLVGFPLILHFGLLQIKPETGRDGANVTTPHAQARGLPAPSNPFLPAPTTPALPRRLRPVWAPRRKSPTAKPGGTDPGSSAANICCSSHRGRRAQGADQTESPRICNLAPDPLTGAPGS